MVKAPGCLGLRWPSGYLPTALFFAVLCGSGAVLRRKDCQFPDPSDHTTYKCVSPVCKLSLGSGTFKAGSMVQHFCEPGYVLAGHPGVSVCKGGQWSMLKPVVCKPLAGVNISEPAPRQPPNSPRGPLESLGDFSGWAISTEELPPLAGGTKPGSAAPRFSWCIKQQRVDLLAEGLWEELLDSYQPNITVMDWYEDSRLAETVYQLHVRLLAADGQTALQEFHHQGPEHGASQEKKNWCHVSHVFHGYGPGVRHVHFQHRTLDAETPGGLRRTRATDSSVSVQLRD